MNQSLAKNMPHGFGVIGCGTIAGFHARAIAETRGARLVGCYSRRPEKAAEFAAAYGCQAYDRLPDMLGDARISAVTVATPSGAHLEPSVAAAKAGKHVLVEKPLEVTLARCDRTIAACAASGVKLGVFFQSRFHEALVELKRAVDAGRFGQLTLGDAYVKWFRPQSYYDSGAWRGTWKLDGGGALMNQAIHSVDLLLWLMGPIVEVRSLTALRAHERIEVEDTAVAALRFANGALGTIEATTAAWPGYLKRIEICGSTGSAIVEEESIVKWDFARPQKRDGTLLAQYGRSTATGGGAADPKAIGHHGHTRQLRDFLQAIKHDREPAVNGAEGRRSVETVLAVYRSAKSGRAVKLR